MDRSGREKQLAETAAGLPPTLRRLFYVLADITPATREITAKLAFDDAVRIYGLLSEPHKAKIVSQGLSPDQVGEMNTEQKLIYASATMDCYLRDIHNLRVLAQRAQVAARKRATMKALGKHWFLMATGLAGWVALACAMGWLPWPEWLRLGIPESALGTIVWWVLFLPVCGVVSFAAWKFLSVFGDSLAAMEVATRTFAERHFPDNPKRAQKFLTCLEGLFFLPWVLALGGLANGFS